MKKEEKLKMSFNGVYHFHYNGFHYIFKKGYGYEMVESEKIRQEQNVYTVSDGITTKMIMDAVKECDELMNNDVDNDNDFFDVEEGNITKEFTDKVGICDYETVERHKEYEHTTPLFQILLDIFDNKLSIINNEPEKWEIINNTSYTETVTYVKNRRDLYLHLSNLDLGAHFNGGSRDLYEYVLNLNNNDVYEISQIIFRSITIK